MSYRADLEVVRLAAGQHGAVTQQQLTDGGVSPSTISRRAAAGMLRSVAKGIYVVPAIENENSLLAAGLLRNATAVASHRSAARLHAMNISDRGFAEITVERGRTHTMSGVTIHETRWLPDADTMTLNGLRLTTPARTLIDLHAVLGFEHYQRVVKDQLTVGIPTAPRFVACHCALARRGRNGTTAVRNLIADLIDDQPFVASELEWRLYNELSERGIHYLRRQFAPPWYNGVEGIVDFADPVGQTIVEADGRSFHQLELDRRRDRARDREAILHGWQPLRYGWHEIVHNTEATMDELVTILEQRRNLAA